MRNEHWDWTYYPSQEDGYKRIDFWLRDESLLTYMLLRDKAPLWALTYKHRTTLE